MLGVGLAVLQAGARSCSRGGVVLSLHGSHLGLRMLCDLPGRECAGFNACLGMTGGQTLSTSTRSASAEVAQSILALLSREIDILDLPEYVHRFPCKFLDVPVFS